jgi:CspA family cold shock protein
LYPLPKEVHEEKKKKMATTTQGEVNIPSVTDTTQKRTHGRVKWFNNKAGYGFISLMEGVNVGQHCFVHHSAIQVNNQQFRYLVEGEYVEFFIIPTNGGTHAFQVGHVSGIGGGKLMCETRYEFKNTRSLESDPPTSPETARSRGEGPRDDNNKNTKPTNNQWSQVIKRRGPPAGGPPTTELLS